MKQQITVEQWNELSKYCKAILADWMYKRGYGKTKNYNKDMDVGYIYHKYSFVLPFIGQLIEYLEEHNPNWDIHPPQKGELNKDDLANKNNEKYWEERDMSNPFDWQIETNSVGSYNCKELCDALWAAVKEDLEKK
jgi:hypothetical protein